MPAQRRFPFVGSQKAIPVYAIRGPNISSELSMLTVLDTVPEALCPLSSVLCHGAAGGKRASLSTLPVLTASGLDFDAPVAAPTGV